MYSDYFSVCLLVMVYEMSGCIDVCIGVVFGRPRMQLKVLFLESFARNLDSLTAMSMTTKRQICLLTVRFQYMLKYM